MREVSEVIPMTMQRLFYLNLFSLLLLFLAGCGASGVTPTPQADVSGSANGISTAMPTLTATPPVDGAGTATPESSDVGGLGVVATLAAELDSRALEPTPTPDYVERELDKIGSETGLSDINFLGLTGIDWINVVISILIFLVGYVVITRLVYHLLMRATQRTKTTFDDKFLQKIGNELQRLIGLIFINYAIERLDFISNDLRIFLNDLIFVLQLILVVIVCLRLVNFTVEWYTKFIQPKESKADHHLDPAIVLLQHASYVLIIVISILVALVHFGIEISLFTGIVLILGLGVVLGARALVSDLVSGFIILVGQPFREGDGIQLEGWPEYGIVEEIGSRVTQIRFFDNRAVIMRNSNVINNQLINYSTSDTTLRVQTDVRIAYHTDLNQIRKLITDTVQGVEGVMPDKPVEVHFRGFGESTRLIRVRWWISDFAQEPYNIDDVNSAIEAALIEAGYEIPFTTIDLNLNQIGDLQQLLSRLVSKTGDRDSDSDNAN
jgi:small-conductance mechanosensitive channel